MDPTDIDWQNLLAQGAPQGVSGTTLGPGMFTPQAPVSTPPIAAVTGGYGAPANTFGAPMPSTGGFSPPPPLAPASAPAASSGIFGQGGIGRNIAGSMGDYLLQRAKAQPIYAPAMIQAQKSAQENNKQVQMLTRQIAEKQYAIDNPAQTDFQKTYEYMLKTNPALAQKYYEQTANPQVAINNPATGALVAMSKGAPAMAATQGLPTITNDDAGHAAFDALPSGAHFIDPTGQTRVKG